MEDSCPYCDAELTYLVENEWAAASDYEFEIECPDCGGQILIKVFPPQEIEFSASAAGEPPSLSQRIRERRAEVRDLSQDWKIVAYEPQEVLPQELGEPWWRVTWGDLEACTNGHTCWIGKIPDVEIRNDESCMSDLREVMGGDIERSSLVALRIEACIKNTWTSGPFYKGDRVVLSHDELSVAVGRQNIDLFRGRYPKCSFGVSPRSESHWERRHMVVVHDGDEFVGCFMPLDLPDPWDGVERTEAV